jgi:hypothetical protein
LIATLWPGRGIEIGGDIAFRFRLGGVHLSLGDQNAVGIGRAGDLAFELRIAGVQQQRTVRMVGDAVALPVAEGHFLAADAELVLRLGEGHFSCRDVFLQRLGEAVEQINRGAQLHDPVFQHPALAQCGREPDDRTDGQCRERNHARQFGADLQTAQQTHFRPSW